MLDELATPTVRGDSDAATPDQTTPEAAPDAEEGGGDGSDKFLSESDGAEEEHAADAPAHEDEDANLKHVEAKVKGGGAG